MIERSACAKVILCGEHAVVYGRPAIALPLPQLRARARVQTRVRAMSGPVEIVAPDLGERFLLQDRPDHPLSQITQHTLNHLSQQPTVSDVQNGFQLTITSDIAVASHLGSGAAVSVACARAVAAHFGVELSAGDASALAFEVEKLHHGTPSGIDNTVIAYEKPVWFVKGAPPEVIEVPSALPLVVADTGISTPTKEPVAAVRASWERSPERLDRQFDAIGMLVMVARRALELNNLSALGTAMNANHAALQQLGVSSLKLDDLCDAALAADALGAKMSGGGRGGNMIALGRDAAHAAQLREALLRAGAVRVY